MNGADRLCEVLLANGVDVCFANPGTSEMHFVAALDRRPAMRCVVGLFEGVVTGAADGYGRMKGRPAATLLHTGPGLANGLANLHNARRARSPIINVVGDHASYHLQFDAPLASDIDSLARPMSDWTGRVRNADDVQPQTEAAYIAAMTSPGVATLVLPADSAWGEASDRPIVPVVVPARPLAERRAIRDAAEALRSCTGRAVLLLGDLNLLEKPLSSAARIAAATGANLMSQYLVGRAARGAGRVPFTQIPYPIDSALAALADVQLLIRVQAPDPVGFFAYPGKPSRQLPETCRTVILADMAEDGAEALEALADELGARPVAPPRPGTREIDAPMPEGTLTEDAVARIVAARLPEDAIVVEEGLTSARRFFALAQHSSPHDYLKTSGGSIGMGIPASIGAAIACPGRKVITLQADGSGMYTLQGLWTQARENLDVITIIFANRAYAILQQEMANMGFNRVAESASRMMSLDDPALDWVQLARGLGVDAARTDDCQLFAALFEAALRTRGPFLIECII